MVSANILIVEDEPVIALDIKRRLINQGYGVAAIADSIETALAAAERHCPDLVLMDIHLRGEVDGIVTADRMRTDFRIPVIFLTAHADQATLDHAKASQPFGYIVKPFETHDITSAIEIALSRYQAEVAMQQSMERERELNEMKSRFVAIVSHEFRNPLSSILFSLDLIDRMGDNLLPEKKQLYIQRARLSVARMKELLEDVLIMGESEAGHLSYNPAPLNLLQFCRDLVDEFQLRVDTKYTIQLSETGEAIDRYRNFYGDEKLLRHILSNLLSNALKYSPKGGEIQLQIIGNEEQIIFRIQDQGIGIPPSDQSRLFESFYRAANVNTIPGTGLGLSIVKQCVEAHNGKITFESTVGVGTTFIVTLDRQSASALQECYSDRSRTGAV